MAPELCCVWKHKDVSMQTDREHVRKHTESCSVRQHKDVSCILKVVCMYLRVAPEMCFVVILCDLPYKSQCRMRNSQGCAGDCDALLLLMLLFGLHVLC